MIAYKILAVICSSLLFFILLLSYSYKKHMSKMAGMLISMTVGMVGGLLIGTIMSLLYTDYFFQVTVFSMFMGAILGVVVGLSTGVMAALDGLLSGLMGGMMGAMLGVMVDPVYASAMVKIMSLLFIGCIFILFLLLNSEVEGNEKVKVKVKGKLSYLQQYLFKLKTYQVFLLLCVCLLLIHLLNFSIPETPSHDSKNRHDQQHIHD